MDKLPLFCKKSRYLTSSQLIMLHQECRKQGIEMTFIHKFMVTFHTPKEQAFLKINPYDGEFFFLSKTFPVKIFYSYAAFHEWFAEQYMRKGEENG